MSNLKSILSSFHLQDELNPKIWELPNEQYMSDPKGQVEVMVPKVRERLLEIAYEFIDFDKQESLVDIITKEGLYRTSQNNFDQASAGYNAKWFRRGGLFGAKLQQERILDFIHSEMLERRDYSASKMCEVIAEFVENEL